MKIPNEQVNPCDGYDANLTISRKSYEMLKLAGCLDDEDNTTNPTADTTLMQISDPMGL